MVGRREILLLILAAAAAAALYSFTRMAAAWNRDIHLQAATYWYGEGQRQQAQGKLSDALGSLREARVNDPENPRYGMALASVQLSTGRQAEAQQTLLHLLASRPDDPEVNLELARLAIAESHADDARRYYRTALGNLWTHAEQQGIRREIRLEFIQFLLRHQERNQALSQILALAAEIPDTVSSHNQAGQLLLEAGDPQRALSEFRLVLRHNRHNIAAEAGIEKAKEQISEMASKVNQ